MALIFTLPELLYLIAIVAVASATGGCILGYCIAAAAHRRHHYATHNRRRHP